MSLISLANLVLDKKSEYDPSDPVASAGIVCSRVKLQPDGDFKYYGWTVKDLERLASFGKLSKS